jgi:hypothetical protein
MSRYTFALLLALSALLSGCNLTAAQWSGIIDGGVKLACGVAVDFVPRADADIAAKVCTGLGIGADTIAADIEAAAAEAKSVRLVQPQGEVAPHRVPLTCKGANVATVPASYAATLAQKRFDARAECKR